ncbi:MAG: energy-coupling factor transporter transmembrane component T family protein [Nitrososphaeria archaeon]
MNWLAYNLISWLIVLAAILSPILILVYPIGLTGLRYVTRYEAHSSLFYRMNPATKLLLLIAASVTASTTLWQINAILSVVLLLSYATFRDGRTKLRLGFWIMLATVIGITWTYAPSMPLFFFRFEHIKPVVLWVWPPYFRIIGVRVLTLQGIIIGLENSCRYTAPFVVALLLIMTTTPSGILRSLRKLGVPDEINFAIVVAMRTIPRIFDAIDLSVKAQFLRGLGSRGSKLLWPAYLLYALLVSVMPSFIYLLKNARNTAIAADTRGFRAMPERTYLNPIRFTRLDLATISLTLLMLAITFYLIYLGYGSPILSFP